MKLSLRDLCGFLRSLREPDYFFFALRTQRTAEGAEVFEQVQTTSPLGGAFLLRAFAASRETNFILFSREVAKVIERNFGMSGWPSRILAVFSIIWGLIVIATVIFNALASNYMMSPEYGWIDAIKSNTIILTVGVGGWYGVYRLTRWFEERS
jgi:hypothetical protein